MMMLQMQAPSLELRLARRLSVRAAVIEHMRWEARNIPSTSKEIAGAIGRPVSSVQRAVQTLVREGAMVRFRMRKSRTSTYMLVDAGGHGVAQWIP